ncbi:unnamed protein product [Lactuca saligna]|uniref:SBP-type domain-containing protein n=1 Tax=Lactuca saligna TaxID=75948 RepID=A0AA36E5X5_LACSI|nr:unnamed protein product [Lactuca saligna]
MDWVLKASSYLSELERDEFDVLQQVMENNQNMEAEAFSVDSGITFCSSSTTSSEPSKKPGGDGVSCLVDGCTVDLSRCRDYHRRHRVCEAHSKTPLVAIAGKHQRFCQQCSRFHSVGEFDEVKRSCRKRLDGHNRRRRKPRGIQSSMYNTGAVWWFTSIHNL